MLRKRLLAGLMAGLAATLAMTALVLIAPSLAGPRVPPLVGRAFAELPLSPGWLAIVLGAHVAYGALAGAFFYGGARAVTLGRGALYGLTLWGVAAAVYAPVVGLGFVASVQPGLAAWALPAHLLYGLVLAACGFDTRERIGLTIAENG